MTIFKLSISAVVCFWSVNPLWVSSWLIGHLGKLLLEMKLYSIVILLPFVLRLRSFSFEFDRWKPSTRFSGATKICVRYRRINLAYNRFIHSFLRTFSRGFAWKCHPFFFQLQIMSITWFLYILSLIIQHFHCPSLTRVELTRKLEPDEDRGYVMGTKRERNIVDVALPVINRWNYKMAVIGRSNDRKKNPTGWNSRYRLSLSIGQRNDSRLYKPQQIFVATRVMRSRSTTRSTETSFRGLLNALAGSTVFFKGRFRRLLAISHWIEALLRSSEEQVLGFDRSFRQVLT